MGTVYAVRHVQIGKRAALKVMHRRLHEPQKNAKRMELEAQVVNAIGHPNIVDIFDVGTTADGRPYIVMEQLSGQSLADLDLAVADVIAIVLQVCHALVAAHAAGVVHRDLKPENIFVTEAREGEAPRVVILDWGIARILNAHARHTLQGQLIGTPKYLAPEQAAGDPVTPKTDVYALGIVLYELVLLQPPFEFDADRATPEDIMALHRFMPPRPPAALWPEIPRRLERLILDMLAKTPGARPTMEEVATRLVGVAGELRARRSSAVAGFDIDPDPDPDPDPEPLPRGRARWPIALGVVALLGVAALIVRAMTAGEPAPLQPPTPMGKPVEASVPVPAEPAAVPAIANPVLDDCADPSVVPSGARWYMTCTGGRGLTIFPIYESPDLATWRRIGWVFSGTRPTWADGHYWSPELHPIPDGFAAYFTMRVANGRHAIGIATANTIAGPYRDAGAPLLAPPEGASDPHVLIDDGRRYLYFKSEGAPSSIRVQALTADGRALSGGARQVLVADAREQDNIEAPWVIRDAGYYYLFYSSARYCDPEYAIRVARSRSPFGPFEKRPQPLVVTGTAWGAPGHVSVTQGVTGERFLVYHAYRLADGVPSCDGGHMGRRQVRVDRLELANGWPRVHAQL